MADTIILGLPYPPLTGVTPNVPRDIQALAEAVEELLVGVSDFTTSASTAVVGGAHAALGTSPSVTLPVAGTWHITFGARVETGSSAGSVTIVGLKVGAAAIVDELQVGSGNATFLTATSARTAEVTATAGTAVTLQGRAITSAGNIDDMYIVARLASL